ncbi:hypothetical protein HZ326_0524 [Fusarium oxysporum f. sp. albedinis]|nr:hypothetical protein HZ326_0524 [Fusarium oxysporum f. sp. albedinis]
MKVCWTCTTEPRIAVRRWLLLLNATTTSSFPMGAFIPIFHLPPPYSLNIPSWPNLTFASPTISCSRKRSITQPYTFILLQDAPCMALI